MTIQQGGYYVEFCFAMNDRNLADSILSKLFGKHSRNKYKLCTRGGPCSSITKVPYGSRHPRAFETIIDFGLHVQAVWNWTPKRYLLTMSALGSSTHDRDMIRAVNHV